MSQEHQQQHHERHEADQELAAAREERLQELQRQAETTTGETPSERAEKAREIIHHQEAAPSPEPSAETTAPTPSHRVLFDQHWNYADTMRSVQRRLSPVSRRFSQVIHAPVIEKTSEMLEKTVARPSATLGATSTALIVGLIFYLTAYHYGYQLSGSELLFSFIVGALIGVLLEGAWRLLPARRK